MEPHDTFSFRVNGTVIIDHSIPCHKPCHPLYGLPTPFTGYTPDRSILIKNTADPAAQMEYLMHAIYHTLTYTPHSTDNTTSAFQQKKGVCKDYTHIMLAVCRHLHIPARYVAGMLLREGATHAWAEIYFNGSWHAYDPTNNRMADETYIIVSRGRDYSDCIIDKGIFQVRHFTSQDMKVRGIVTDAGN